MNCKPGDIAVIVHPQMAGKLVTVLYLAPDGRFILPNGTPAAGDRITGGYWVIQSLGAPFAVTRSSRPARNMYAVCHDRWLRPVRGEGLGGETPTEIDKPQPAEVA